MSRPCLLTLAAAIAAMAITSPAAAALSLEHTSFAATPVPLTELASVYGTGSGYDANFATMVRERTRIDADTFAGLNGVSMDAWWAYTGSILIAASLR